MPSSSTDQPGLRVAIVSRNSGTLGDLEAYLQRAGVTTIGTQQIERSPEIMSGVSAVVVFPDDFEWETVVPALNACLHSSPRALPVVVTNAPQRFEAFVGPDDCALPLVIPRPAWGWTILEAIRSHLTASANPDDHQDRS
jgi:hypothetical protein